MTIDYRKLCLMLFFFLIHAKTSIAGAETSMKDFIKHLISTSTECYWIDKVGGTNTGVVKADTKDKNEGDPITCFGNLKCFSNHPIHPDIYFQDIACPGKIYSSGNVKCQEPMDCLKDNPLTQVKTKGQERTVSPTGPPPVLPPEFQPTKVVK